MVIVQHIKLKRLIKQEDYSSKWEELPEILEKALREIIVNAFAHSDYESFPEIDIGIHPGKIEIYNPGSFPDDLTPEDFIENNILSMVRNPIILKALFLSEDVESYSSGFRRVYEECKLNNVNTDYIMNREGFMFIVQRNVVNPVVENVVNKDEVLLSDDEKLVLTLIKENNRITANRIAEIINKSPRTVQRIISGLKTKGFLERIGGTKGYWKIN